MAGGIGVFVVCWQLIPICYKKEIITKFLSRWCWCWSCLVALAPANGRGGVGDGGGGAANVQHAQTGSTLGTIAVWFWPLSFLNINFTKKL